MNDNGGRLNTRAARTFVFELTMKVLLWTTVVVALALAACLESSWYLFGYVPVVLVLAGGRPD